MPSRSHALAVVVFALVAVATGTAAAQNCVDYDAMYPIPTVVVGEIPSNGLCETLEVKGDRAYLASSVGLLIFDVADWSEPRFLGRTAEGVTGVAVASPYVYGVSGSDTMQVILAAVPQSPTVVNRVLTVGVADRVALDPAGLYTLERVGQDALFSIWRLGSPTAPTLIGQWWLGLAIFADVDVCGDVAYIISHDLATEVSSLDVIDLSDLSHPFRRAQLALPGEARALDVVGPFAYVGGDSGLCVVDVTEPTVPQLVSTSPDVGDIYSLDAVGSTCFAFAVGSAWPAGDVVTIDVSVPQHPIVLGRGSTSTVMYDLSARLDGVFAAQDHSGLKVVDVTDLAHPTVLPWQRGLPGACSRAIATHGGAVLVSPQAGLIALDLADPTAPDVLTTFPVTGTGHGMCTVDATLFWGGYRSGSGVLDAIDLSDAAAPTILASITLPDFPLALAGTGGYVYGVSQVHDILVIDARDPASPAYVGYVNLPGQAREVTASGSILYVLSADGVRALDVSQPESPQVLGFYPILNQSAIAATGAQVYVSGLAGGLSVIDFGDPQAPAHLATMSALGDTYRLQYASPYLFMCGNFLQGGVLLVDVSMPSAPAVVGVTAVGRTVVDLVPTTRGLLLAEGDLGAQVAPLPCQLTGVGDGPNGRPAAGLTAHPNPFNPSLDIAYEITTAGPVRLTVHDLRGRVLAVLHDGDETAGPHVARWSGRDASGRELPSGVYLVRLVSSTTSVSRKVTLLR